MGRRTLLLVAALVVAALGTSLVFLYVNSADARAEQKLSLVEGLVAKEAIAAGTTGAQAASQGLFETKRFTAESVPADQLVTNPAELADLTTLAPLAAGQPVLRANFGTAGSSGVLPIPEGKIAISVQLSDPARVAGFVDRGSQVAIFYTPEEGQASAGGAAAPTFTAVLLPRVDVITTGGTFAQPVTTTNAEGQQTTEQIPKAILTLAVSQREASKIIYAQGHGELYLGLLTEDAELSVGQRVGPDNLFAN